MITAKQLEKYDWYCSRNDKISWYYDNWEYEFNVSSQILYYINDGYGEPQLIARITNMDELIETYYALEGKEMKKIKD